MLGAATTLSSAITRLGSSSRRSTGGRTGWHVVAGVLLAVAVASAWVASAAGTSTNLEFRWLNLWWSVGVIVLVVIVVAAMDDDLRDRAPLLLIAAAIVGVIVSLASFLVLPLRLRFELSRTDLTHQADNALAQLAARPGPVVDRDIPITFEIAGASSLVHAIGCGISDERIHGLEIGVSNSTFSYCPHLASREAICCDAGGSLASLGGGWYVEFEGT